MPLFRPFVLVLIACMAAALPAAAEEVRIKPAALALNAQLDLASGKALKDGVVLIVHGTLAHNDMETLKTLRGVLNDRGLNTLAINLSLAIDDRHGMYDCKTPHRHRHLDALDEISAWMDWLKGQGAGPVALFGHSRGGNQAARYVAERGHPMISKLALLAPATWNAGKTAQGFEKSHGRPLAPDLAAAEALVKAGKSDVLLEKPGLLYCPTAKVSAASFVSYYRPDPRFDTPAILGEIKVPVLVMAGSNDTVVADLPEKMKGKADGAKVAFKVIDGADHFFLDLYAEDVGDAMAAFIAGG
jgi:pimeloyl-ACP methyl ester carboxylesterase